MIDINKLTIAEAREIAALLNPPQLQAIHSETLASLPEHPYNIGKNYFIRTVTHHHTGTLVRVTQQELVLTNAAWIPSDGRFTQALEKCEFDEVEMFPKGSHVIIGRGSIIDAVEVDTYPKSQK